MERLDCDRMFIAVMETGSFTAAAQRLGTSHGQASKLISRLEQHLGVQLFRRSTRALAADEKGGFVRQTSSFRHWGTPDGAAGPTGEAGFKAEVDRYHLYVALICPWASRTLIARKLKGLEKVVSLSVVEPWLLDEGWHFGDYPGANKDELNQAEWVHQLYTQADATFTGRATVPVLWDKKTRTIVNNESADIVRMFNSGFGELASNSFDLYPADWQSEIKALNPNGIVPAGPDLTAYGL